jgi:membrane protein
MDNKKHKFFSFYGKVLKNSVQSFDEEDVLTQAAALAYYMIFSLPPMLFIIFWAADFLYDDGIVREAVFQEFGKLIGEVGSNQIKETTEGLTSKPTWWETSIGVIFMFIMISTVFVTIQRSLNRIFEVDISRSVSASIWHMLRYRLLSIAMLGIIAFILTFSLVISAFFNGFVGVIQEWIGNYTIWLMLFDYVVLNFIGLTILFAVMFRYMPDTRLKWGETLFGAIFTSILFIIGKSLIGMFIGKSEAANFYDAAGGILVLMLWIYYTSIIFLSGAIITQSRSKLLKEEGS